MKKSLNAVVATMGICAMVAGAVDAYAAPGKTRTKSNNSNDRAVADPVSGDPVMAQKCASGKHFATVKLTARSSSGDGGMACDAATVESGMTVCSTDGRVYSWGTNMAGQLGDGSGIVFRDDATAADRVSSSSVAASQDSTYATPHLALCDALHKAVAAINADPEKLAAVQAKVNMQDFHFARQMLVDNGVPADLLSDPGGSESSKTGWDLKSNKKERMASGASSDPLVITISWDQDASGKVNKTGHVTLMK